MSSMHSGLPEPDTDALERLGRAYADGRPDIVKAVRLTYPRTIVVMPLYQAYRVKVIGEFAPYIAWVMQKWWKHADSILDRGTPSRWRLDWVLGSERERLRATLLRHADPAFVSPRATMPDPPRQAPLAGTFADIPPILTSRELDVANRATHRTPGYAHLPVRHAKLHKVADRQGGWTCFYCHRPTVDVCDDEHVIKSPDGRRTLKPGRHPRMATIDHVVARTLGGSENFENLVLACLSCNASKGAA